MIHVVTLGETLSLSGPLHFTAKGSSPSLKLHVTTDPASVGPPRGHCPTGVEAADGTVMSWGGFPAALYSFTVKCGVFVAV